MSQEISGRCFCEKVRFQITKPTKWCAHCHCSMCRRAHGAALVTWVGVETDRFTLLAGRDQLQWYQSSAQARRGFCRDCGSTMFFESSRWPGEIHITLANIQGEMDREPSAHAFFETHVDWLAFNDELKKRP